MVKRMTLVVGASPEPTRYSHMAALRLLEKGHPVLLMGKRKGAIGGVAIQSTVPEGAEVHTITMYVAPAHQQDLMDGLLALRPARIIFNPGTENPAFEAAAKALGMEVVEGCTLVMLATGAY